ncbi:MAG TPA: hypothetical protein VL588_08520 [Bdellovibrionota bacterium]|jgi:hypothetical protein|nr:hypothetical protein [Bdellovibrionota bacterium]
MTFFTPIVPALLSTLVALQPMPQKPADPSPATPGNGEQMMALFDGISAKDSGWAGEGTYRRLLNTGAVEETAFEVKSAFKRGWATHSWDANTNLDWSNGTSTQDQVTFLVQGDRLLLQTTAGQEPVTVVSATPTDLTYRYFRSYQGYIYVYTHHLTLGETDLTVHSTLELSTGLLLEEQQWTAH